MSTQESYHPESLGWEIDEDLRRARLVFSARSGIAIPGPAATAETDESVVTLPFAHRIDGPSNQDRNRPNIAASYKARSFEEERSQRKTAPHDRPTTSTQLGSRYRVDTHHQPARVEQSSRSNATNIAPHHEASENKDSLPTAQAEIDKHGCPTSAQGGWRPWVFATAGLVGGNLAMSVGGVSANYLPTIIIVEFALAIFVCMAFYPRNEADCSITAEQLGGERS